MLDRCAEKTNVVKSNAKFKNDNNFGLATKKGRVLVSPVPTFVENIESISWIKYISKNLACVPWAYIVVRYIKSITVLPDTDSNPSVILANNYYWSALDSQINIYFITVGKNNKGLIWMQLIKCL